MIKRIFAAIGALLVTAGIANAYEERWPKWYVGVHGSMPFVGDTGTRLGSVNTGEVEFDNPGWGVGASLGYKPGGTQTFVDMIRFELEYAYRANDLDTLAGATIADDISAHSVMFNALYDIDTGTNLVPYLGAGLGWSNVELSVPAIALNDEDNVFSYQFLAGIGYEPQTMPNVAFTLGYRYFGTSDPEFTLPAGKFKHEYDYHAAEVGARFAF